MLFFSIKEEPTGCLRIGPIGGCIDIGAYVEEDFE